MASQPDFLEISLNGEPRVVKAHTLAQLLAELGWSAQGVAIAVNESVVPRAKHGEFPLKSGDRLEIIRAVQGG